MIADKIIHGTRRKQGGGGENDVVKHERQNMLNSENVINNFNSDDFLYSDTDNKWSSW